jgi:hypothetical protein
MQTFVIDQAATFQALAFLSIEPRMEFGSAERQETDREGTPKWDVQLVGAFRGPGGKLSNEVIKVGMTSVKRPGEGLSMYQPVHLVNFVVGITPAKERTGRDGERRVTGGTAWYRCDDIRPASVAPTAKG